MENSDTKYISEEKALTKIQELLDAGANINLVAAGLTGLDSDKAWDMRRDLLDAGADKSSVASGLAGIDSEKAWEIRKYVYTEIINAYEAIKSFGDYLSARHQLKHAIWSLIGLDSDSARDMRMQLCNIDTTWRSDDSCQAHDSIYLSLIEGLVGLDSDMAWETRNEIMCLPIHNGPLMSSIAKSLAGLDTDRAWAMRETLPGLGASLGSMASGVAGIDSERAWNMRDAAYIELSAIHRKAKVEVQSIADAEKSGDLAWDIANSIAGLDTARAWAIREVHIKIGVDINIVAKSLAGLDTNRAWAMRETLLGMGADRGYVAMGIVGDYNGYIWRKVAKEIKKDEHNKFPRTYVVYDLETTGLDWKKEEAMEIGALLVRDGQSPVLKKWTLKPSVPVTAEICKITGISQNDVDRFGRDPDECWREFVEFTGINQTAPPYPFVGHNITCFDNLFTQRAIKNIGSSLINVRCIDTAAMYKGKKMGLAQGKEEPHEVYAKRILETRVCGLKYKLEMVYRELGGLMDDVKAHCVEGDVKMTNFVYRKLVNLS